MNKTITVRVCVDDESAEVVAQDFREELSGQTDEPITAHYSAEFLAKHAVTIDDGVLVQVPEPPIVYQWPFDELYALANAEGMAVVLMSLDRRDFCTIASLRAYCADVVCADPLDGDPVVEVEFWRVAGPDVLLLRVTVDLAPTKKSRELLDSTFEAGTRYVLVQDDDCHWYCVPYTLVDAFYSACNVLANTGDDQVMSKFQQFALGGAPGLITFTDPQVTR